MFDITNGKDLYNFLNQYNLSHNDIMEIGREFNKSKHTIEQSYDDMLHTNRDEIKNSISDIECELDRIKDML